MDLEKIILQTSNLTKPLVFYNCFDDFLFSENDIKKIINNSTNYDLHHLSQRVYLGNMRSDEYSVKINQTKISEDENIQEWCSKIFGNSEFGIIINNADKVCENITRKANSIVKPIFDKVGLSSGGFSVAIFIGNYKYSPIGVHIDKNINNVLHFHLSDNEKEMLLWEKEDYLNNVGSVNPIFELNNLEEHKYSFKLKKYCIFNLPASEYYHIGKNNDFTIDIAIVFQKQTKKQLIENLILEFLNDFYKIENENQYINYLNDFKNDLILENSNLGFENFEDLINEAIKRKINKNI